MIISFVQVSDEVREGVGFEVRCDEPGRTGCVQCHARAHEAERKGDLPRRARYLLRSLGSELACRRSFDGLSKQRNVDSDLGGRTLVQRRSGGLQQHEELWIELLHESQSLTQIRAHRRSRRHRQGSPGAAETFALVEVHYGS